VVGEQLGRGIAPGDDSDIQPKGGTGFYIPRLISYTNYLIERNREAINNTSELESFAK
jgi:hypothetical protein